MTYIFFYIIWTAYLENTWQQEELLEEVKQMKAVRCFEKGWVLPFMWMSL